MSNKKSSKNDEILAIRMPAQLLYQLNALAESKSLGTSSMARMVLAQYLTEEAPKALIGISSPLKPQGKILNKLEQQLQAMSPSERKAYEEQFDSDWA